MAVIFYGTKKKIKTDKSLGVQTCPNCGHEVELSLAHESGYYHIYWLPLFPIIGWKFKACPKCGMAKKLTSQEFKELKKC